MRMEEVVVREGGKRRQILPVDMSVLCWAGELDGITAELWRRNAASEEPE
jgi:hypothetical protein